jgi:hypothetical protein
MCTTITAYEPCACNWTWLYNPETGRMEEYRRACLKHLEVTEA